MTRHLFFAITVIGAGGLLNSPAEAQQWQCEDRASNCLGRCANRTGGAGDLGGHQIKCLSYCDRQLIRCVDNAVSRDPWLSTRRQPYPAIQ
jgi:hypothetical protein